MLGAEHLETRKVDSYSPPPCRPRHTLLQTGTLGSKSRLWQDLCNLFWRRRDSPVHREGRLEARACPSSLTPTERLSPRGCLGRGLGTAAHRGVVVYFLPAPTCGETGGNDQPFVHMQAFTPSTSGHRALAFPGPRVHAPSAFDTDDSGSGELDVQGQKFQFVPEVCGESFKNEASFCLI